MDDDLEEISDPADPRLVVKDDRDIEATIDGDGNMKIRGTVQPGLTSIVATGASLIIKNSTDDIVACIDDAGNVKLLGQIFEGGDPD